MQERDFALDYLDTRNAGGVYKLNSRGKTVPIRKERLLRRTKREEHPEEKRAHSC